MKLGLGTVQLGMDYGIANSTGQPIFSKAMEILLYAYERGITVFDTASSYGTSESLLGSFRIKYRPENMRICSKLKSFRYAGTQDMEKWVFDEVYSATEKLSGKIDYMLFHNAQDLLNHGHRVMPVLGRCQQQGLIGKIGVSVYSPDEIYKCLEHFDLDVIQSPFNVMDCAVMRTVDVLNQKGIELHSRSVYLQGLLLLDESRLPSHMKLAIPYLEKYGELCRSVGLSKQAVAFLYVRDQIKIDRFIVGCESVNQLKENIELYSLPALPEELVQRISRIFSDVPEKITNPSKWRI